MIPVRTNLSWKDKTSRRQLHQYDSDFHECHVIPSAPLFMGLARPGLDISCYFDYGWVLKKYETYFTRVRMVLFILAKIISPHCCTIWSVKIVYLATAISPRNSLFSVVKLFLYERNLQGTLGTHLGTPKSTLGSKWIYITLRNFY